MGDDLISREKALEVVKRHMCDSANIEQGILELPTAYSIAKVVKQINEERGMERLTNAGTKEAKASITIREVTNKLAEYEDLEEQAASAIYHECPVCGVQSTSKRKIEQHFRRHQIKTEELVYCTICGAGYYVSAYGKKRATEMARECYKRHFIEEEADQTAGETFFLTGGQFGYVRMYGNQADE